MATLYFKGTDFGSNGDWSSVANWFTSVDSNGNFVGAAGRVPIATDNVIICGTLTNISNDDGDGNPNYSNPISIQLGYVYNNATDGLYQAYWNGSAFTSPSYDVGVSTIVNVGPPNDGRFDNTNFWAYPISGIRNVSYAFTTLNVNDANCSFEGVATVVTANFYSHNGSYNGGNDTSGTLYGTVNFYGYSSNSNQNSGNEGVVIGTANFYNTSYNFDPNSGTAGIVNGTANFYDNSSEFFYTNSSPAPYAGTIIGTLNFKSTTGLTAFLSNYAGTSKINYSGSGGGSVTSILLTELLKLPFPIVI